VARKAANTGLGCGLMAPQDETLTVPVKAAFTLISEDVSCSYTDASAEHFKEERPQVR
jgi:hypothetical protein